MLKPDPTKKSATKLKVRKLSAITLKRIDHTAIWSRLAARKRRFNPMDPNPDPPLDLSKQEYHEPHKDKEGNIKLELTPEDWKRFWVDRIRRHYKVDAPNLTDNEMYSSVVRAKRVYQRSREDESKPHIDPDLPSCYYWNVIQVVEWLISQGFPRVIQDMFRHFNISGRRLILIDPSNLSKMGVSDPDLILAISKAARTLLGLPKPNVLRAISRFVALERFLHLKIRTGPNNERFTFKEFCELEGMEYEAAKKQKDEGYKKIPCSLKVTVIPGEEEDVKWIPTEPRTKQKSRERNRLPYYPYRPGAEYDIHRSPSGTSSSSDGISLQEFIPTVEELLKDAMLRNEFIPEILADIIDAVIREVREQKGKWKCKQELADEILKLRLEQAYSYFNVSDPEEKLKLVTMIAEDLVEDVIKAKDILSDIDGFQRAVSPEELLETQEAVTQYVQDIMPVVVKAALKEMQASEESLRSLNEKDAEYVDEICVLRGPTVINDESDSDISILELD